MVTENNKNTIGLMDEGGADRINSISTYLKKKFGRKMIKLGIDAGFTCPNRDGAKGIGGCSFCGESAGSDFASSALTYDAAMDQNSFDISKPYSCRICHTTDDLCATIKNAIDRQIELYNDKWPDAGYIAYFQSHTNTYAPVDVLHDLYYAALNDSRIEGIAIATRPDCLPDNVLDLLSEINREHFMWVELGLQTIHERTAKLIGRCYSLNVYDKALFDLTSRDIKVVTHLILGLPGESNEDMFETVRHVCATTSSASYLSGADPGMTQCTINQPDKSHPATWGLKLHMLNIVKGSRMAIEMPNYQPFDSIDEYTDLVCDIIELIPENVVIHRLTADTDRKNLIAPEWSYRKRSILNDIHKKLRERGTRQGFRADI